MIFYNLLDSNVHYKHTTTCYVNAKIKFKMKKGFHVIYCTVTCNLKIWKDIRKRFEYIYLKTETHYTVLRITIFYSREMIRIKYFKKFTWSSGLQIRCKTLSFAKLFAIILWVCHLSFIFAAINLASYHIRLLRHNFRIHGKGG